VQKTIEIAPSLAPYEAPLVLNDATAATGRNARIRKVIFVLHSHVAGGAEQHLLQLMHALSGDGIHCIYAGPLDGWLGAQLLAAGFQCEHIAYRGFFDIASLLKLVHLIVRERPDIVHGHLTRGAFYSGLASRLTSVPNVATAHSTHAGKWFGMAQRVIAVSDAVRGFLAARGYAQQILRTVRHGIPNLADLPRASRDSMRIHLRLDAAPVLTMAARFTPAKGQDIALRALAQLAHLDWTLVLAGSLETDYAGRMQQLAAELGIAARVRFTGHRDDIANIYGCTDILLAPSRREALSLTLLEAASFGIPVVASNAGGIGEAVRDGVTGILVEVDDVDGIALQVQRLLEDETLRRSMGAAGRRRYEECFAVETMARATLDVYEQVAARSAP